jgi:hypothetical protein
MNEYCATMRRHLAICLLLFHLIGSTAFGELLRLPALIQHYQEHRTADWALNLNEFLALHYAPDHAKQHSDPGDHELPFHSPDGAVKLMSLLALTEKPADTDHNGTNWDDAFADAEQGIRSNGNPDPRPRPPRHLA